jgi:hypothetical protein
MIMSRDQNAEWSQNVKFDNSAFKNANIWEQP